MKLLATSDLIEAEVMEARLDAFGISCFLQKNNVGGMRPSLSFVEGVKIFVSESDYERALAVIQIDEGLFV
jgi:hypothetical protein